jgi:hypothetical protein
VKDIPKDAYRRQVFFTPALIGSPLVFVYTLVRQGKMISQAG